MYNCEALFELFVTDGLCKELVHAGKESLAHESCFSVGSAAADYRVEPICLTCAMLLEKCSSLPCYLRAIHIWHTVVEQDKLVHLSFTLLYQVKALLDLYQSL